jgi:DNA-binding response OmpR family regulator
MAARIVLVEDDPEDSLFLQQAFVSIGYHDFQSFNDAFAFIDFLTRNDADLPKLVILDYNMPKISGFQLLAYLKHNERFSGIKAILYSDHTNEDYKVRCLKAGALDYVKKLTSMEEMIAFAKRASQVVETGTY